MNRKELYDKFLKEVSAELDIDELYVFEVISHQWRTAQRAIASKEVSSLEISGFGKFTLRPKQVQKHLKKLNIFLKAYQRKLETETDELLIERLQKKISSVTEEISLLESKLKDE